MEVTIKKLSIDNNSTLTILPKSIFTDLDLSMEKLYTIHFGNSAETSLVGFSEMNDKDMYFPENIFNGLNLLQDITINIWKTDNDIFIGPVVGIFVSIQFMREATGKQIYSFVERHLEASTAENCLAYFYCLNDIDLESKRIKGFTFIPELNKYDYSWFPIPDVVYNKNISSHIKIIELWKHLNKNYHIKLINNCTMLGKWELSQALCKYPEAKKYVPETIMYTDFDDVLSMLNKYKFIFLKSFYGSEAKEVLSVEKLNDKYKLNYNQGSAIENILDNIDDLKIFITKFVGKTNFIIQQGLKLLKYKDCTMDVRMFMMKNEFGKWESVYKIVRIAKKDFNITTAAGKRLTVYEKIYPVLKDQYCSVEVPSIEKLNDAAALLAGYIEMGFASMGEMGIDIGIDINGQIWIIEANSSPAKNLSYSVFDVDGVPLPNLILKYYKGTNKNDKIMPQASGIFKYAKFLTATGKD